jgi:hypothetical protein
MVTERLSWDRGQPAPSAASAILDRSSGVRVQDFGLDLGGVITLPLDGNSPGAHPVARGIARAPRDKRPYDGEIAGHCLSPDDCAQNGNARRIRSALLTR